MSSPLIDEAVGALPIVESIPAAPKKGGRRKKPSTAHLKQVPQERAVRMQVKEAAAIYMKDVDRSVPLTKETCMNMAQELLISVGLDPLSNLGFGMVCINNEFWREQLMAVDFSRRLLLLPHCLKHAEGCPAEYDEFGLNCRECGACEVADFKVIAEDLGYKVLVAEGSPIVLKILVSGYIDGVVGVACLNVLEKAFDKLLTAGVPAMAVPLLSSDCKNTSVDEDWVQELISLKSEMPASRTRTYLPLLRKANEIFEKDELERLVARPRKRAVLSAFEKAGKILNGSTRKTLVADPVASTEQIAFDFLARGGKRSRPFITLAAYDALAEGNGTDPKVNGDGVDIPDHVLLNAISIETFHKASLVHDDIEDDDVYRYGTETLHCRYGMPIALNVGDYLIGQGYQMICKAAAGMGSDVAADILNRLSRSHVKLSEGQGAELTWRESGDKSFSPLDALKIYALKTAPAFEVALYSGVRLAGGAEPYEKLIADFSRNLGVAFQILNDLNDWEGDDYNKLVSGGDVLSARPTLLLALALESAGDGDKQSLLDLLDSEQRTEMTIRKVRRIYDRCQVFAKADKLVEKYRARTEAIADEVENSDFRSLLYFLVDTILDKEETDPSEAVMSLPVVNPALVVRS
ncbi:MAG: polyprenyl synthetase family protein [Planctomycetota bacterium]|nr:polyprenyl synthetase family protein [Planctomycetota bacterium]